MKLDSLRSHAALRSWQHRSASAATTKQSRRGDFVHEYGVGAMWLNLAQRWKRPVQEIKRICRPGSYDETPVRAAEAVFQEQQVARRTHPAVSPRAYNS